MAKGLIIPSADEMAPTLDESIEATATADGTEDPDSNSEKPLDSSLNTPVTPPRLQVSDFSHDRTEGVLFSPIEHVSEEQISRGYVNEMTSAPELPPRAPNLPPRKVNNVPTQMDKSTACLIMERESLYDYTIKQFKSMGFLSTTTDVNADILKAEYDVERFNYDLIEEAILFKVVTKVKYLNDDIFNMIKPPSSNPDRRNYVSSIVNELAALKEFKFKDTLIDDCILIYSLLETTDLVESQDATDAELPVSPLVILLLYFTKGDKLVCLIMGYVIHQFILNPANNQRFLFMLLRSIEDSNSLLMLKNIHSIKETFVQEVTENGYWIEKLNSWFENGSLNLTLKNLIIYGPFSLIGDLTLRIPDFYAYQIEFDSLNHANNKEINLKNSNDRLKLQLNKLKNDYTNLLVNFQQLNGELMRVKTLIKMKSDANHQLQSDLDGLNLKLNNNISQFDVLKVRKDKNNEIELVNEGLRREIEKLQRQLAK